MDGGYRDKKRARIGDGPGDKWSSDKPNFLFYNGNTVPDYLTHVSDHVSAYKHQTFHLMKPAGAKLVIADLDDTIYKGHDDEVNGWSMFYLPNKVNMQVLGIVEGTSCPCEQLVLMTCEDRKVYAYDGGNLHVVASNLEELFDQGLEYPASRWYYDGEAFKHMTKKDWAKVKDSPLGRRLDREHHKQLTANKSRFLENLRSKRHQTGVTC